jgi:hypothetical protein
MRAQLNSFFQNVLHVSRTLADLHLAEPRSSAFRLALPRAVLAGTSHLRRQLASR